MAISNDELETKINGILQNLDFTSQFYGRLLNWQGTDGFWHYGIGLSDTLIFDTSPLMIEQKLTLYAEEL